MTTPAMADMDRAEFETWAGSHEFDLRRPNKSYVNTATAYAWEGWQAARSALPQQVVAAGSIDTAELRKLALAATQGEWMRGRYGAIFSKSEGYGLASASINGTFCRNHSANEDFIAAANPKTILALLDALDARQPAPVKPEGLTAITRAALDAVVDESIAADNGMENEQFHAGKMAGILSLKLAILAKQGAAK